MEGVMTLETKELRDNQGGRIKEWDEKDKMGCMEDAMGEL